MKGYLIVLLAACCFANKAYGEACKKSVDYPIENSYNCSCYFECVNDNEEEKFCPAGFHFNPTLKACDFPEDAGCILITSSQPTESSTAASSTDRPSTIPPTTSTASPSTIPPTTSTASPSTIPPTTSTARPSTIPPTTSTAGPSTTTARPTSSTFEPTTTTPIWSTTQSDNDTTTLHPGVICSNGIEFYPHPTDTNKYYECINGNAVERSCPNGLYFHPIELKCTTAEAICKNGVQYIPHPYDCKKFYECDFRIPYLFECPGVLHFHPIYFICDFPENVQCKPGPKDPQEEPSCDQDKKDMLPHPSDCSKYYECKEGQLYNYSCPSGLHFNNVTQSCDWPSNVNCKKGKITRAEIPPVEDHPDCKDGETKYLPNEENCNHFYRCYAGDRYEYTCPEGLHWNQKAETCDYPESAGCQKSKASTFEIPPVEDHPDCKDGETKYLPNEENCNHFYRCYAGDRYEYTCPEGLHWNQKAETCDYPESAGCQKSKASTFEIPPIEDHPDCKDGETKYLPNEENCNHFYRCYAGDRYEYECPEGLHWNQKAETCDYPESAGCQKSKASTFEFPPIANHPDCKDGETKYLPNKENCNHFFRCFAGDRYEYVCPAGLHWNQKAEACDYPELAGCQKSLFDIPPVENHPDCKDGETKYLPDKENCSRFYRCFAGDRYEYTCPAELHWNQKTEACDYPETAGCQKVSTFNKPSPKNLIDDCEVGVTKFLPNRENCQNYFLCANSKKVELTCPEEFLFDEKAENCVRAELASCQKEQPPINNNSPPEINHPDCKDGETKFLPDKKNCGRYYQCFAYNRYEFWCPPNLHWNVQKNVCDYPREAGCEVNNLRDISKPIENHSDCEDGETKYLPNKENCNHFFVCFDYDRYEYECPADLHWNAKEETCDYPKHAGCEKNF